MDEEPPCGCATANSHLFIYLFIYSDEFRDSYDDYPVAGYNAADGNYEEPEKRYPSLDG